MKNQTFGIEIETTGLGCERTAKAIAAAPEPPPGTWAATSATGTSPCPTGASGWSNATPQSPTPARRWSARCAATEAGRKAD